MNNLIQKELQLFQKFKKDFSFTPKEIIEIDGILYCDDIALFDDAGKLIPKTEKWINVKYNAKDFFAKVLSNLFPYTFEFRGEKLNSLEAFFQGIKFPDPNVQRYVFSYSGIDAFNIQIANEYDWKSTGCLFWQGQKIKRDSEEYTNLVDEVYISAIQNPLYRQALKNVDRYILHSIGKQNINETVFTRYEFELELNCLSAFIKTI